MLAKVKAALKKRAKKMRLPKSRAATYVHGTLTRIKRLRKAKLKKLRYQ